MNASYEVSAQLPKSIKVSRLISSRYSDNLRPESWDLRVAGIDFILAEDGHQYALLSDGQQSPPQAGNTIIIRELQTINGSREAYTWTLYGI